MGSNPTPAAQRTFTTGSQFDCESTPAPPSAMSSRAAGERVVPVPAAQAVVVRVAVQDVVASAPRSLRVPPLSVVSSVVVKTPRRSSIVTVSLPPPAFTTTAVNRERAKEYLHRAVRPDVDLEDPRGPALQPQRELAPLPS